MKTSDKLTYLDATERSAFYDSTGKPTKVGQKLEAQEKKKRLYGILAIVFGVVAGVGVIALAGGVIREVRNRNAAAVAYGAY